MSQEKTENGSIRVNAKAGSQNTRVSATNTNSTNPVTAANSKAQMYEQMALSHANDANIYAQQAEKSAINSANSAAQASNSVDAILLNEDFIAVNNSLSDINLVSDNIYSINYVAKNQEKIEQIVENLNNLGDTTNINIVASNISDVNTNAENIISINKVANSISNVDNIANNLTEVLNSKTYANNAKTSATSAQTYANNSLTYSNNASNSANLAQQWAVSSSKVENTDYSSKYYANQAKSSATTATSQATIATNKANEAINTVANTLNKTQITNCLLEVPEKIKYTLLNGVLTLKAGSEIVIPNGFESDGTTRKFNKVILNKDVTFAYGGKAENLVVCATASGQFFSTIMTYALSDSSEPTVGANRVIWFDATNNIVKTKTSGGSWTTGLSFPLFIVDLDLSAKVTNLKNVFNGFGFIGHHTFSYEGVKALIPNGRNADDTLNNKEVISTSTIVQNETGKASQICFFDGSRILTYGVNNYFEQDYKPTGFTGSATWLNTKENVMYSTSDSGATWVSQPRMYLGGLKKQTASGDFVEASFITPVELVKKEEFVRNVDEINSNINTIETNITNLTNNKITVDNSSMVVSSSGVLCKLGDRNFYKRNEGWAICALVYFTSGYGGPILIGKTADAVKQYNDHTTTDTDVKTLTYKGTTYYYSTHTSSMPLTSDMLKAYSYPVFTNRSESTKQMAQRVLLQYYSSTNFSAPVNSYVNGTSWWKMWGDGWIEQGGRIVNTAGSGTLTFLKAFSNTNYTLVGSSLENSKNDTGGTSTSISFDHLTTTSFYYSKSSGQSDMWYACGY